YPPAKRLVRKDAGSVRSRRLRARLRTPRNRPLQRGGKHAESSGGSPLSSFRRNSEFVNGAVRERIGERVIDQLVLVDQREAAEARRGNDDLEVVTASRAIDDLEL